MKDALKIIYEPDRDDFFVAFSKEKILDSLEKSGNFTLGYRLLENGYAKFRSDRSVSEVYDRADDDLRKSKTTE